MPDKDAPVDGAFVGHATRVTFEQGCSVSFVGQAVIGSGLWLELGLFLGLCSAVRVVTVPSSLMSLPCPGHICKTTHQL